MADRALKRAARVLAQGWSLHAELAPLGDGHINDTLLATTSSRERFVLQRINRTVFHDPSQVMTNLVRIIDHIGARDPHLLPDLVAASSGRPAYVDESGDWWRLWRHVAGGRSINRTTDPHLCRAAGEAFGRFQRLLADLPGPALEPTIPGFLQLEHYLNRFDTVVAGSRDAADAVRAACGDPGFIDEHRPLAHRFPPGRDRIHGDCKLNNLLFAAHDPVVLAVLDLDTVMEGHWAWDLGDLARSVLMSTGSASGTTDARSLLAALIDGFSDGSGRSLELDTALEAALYVAFMLGLRFLTDHLEGDRYFRVDRHGANLDRSREQFALVRRLRIGDLVAPPARPTP